MTRIPTNLPPEDDNEGQLQPLQPTDASMPMMSGFNKDADNIEEEGITFGEPEGKFKLQGQTVVALAIVAVIACGAIYGMHTLNKKFQAQSHNNIASETKIETYLTKLSNQQSLAKNDPMRSENISNLLRDTPEIIGMLQSDVSEQQIPIEFVQKDPFRMGGFKRAQKSQGVDPSQQKAIRTLRALQGELQTLNLNSVMGGRIPVAVINNEFYRKGDKIGSFRIKEIHHHSQSVLLEASGQHFDLVME